MSESNADNTASTPPASSGPAEPAAASAPTPAPSAPAEPPAAPAAAPASPAPSAPAYSGGAASVSESTPDATPDATADMPPVSAPPAAAPAPARRGRGGFILLTILTMVFLLAAGGMGGLYLVEKDKADTKIASQTAEITTLKKQVADDATKLKSTEEQLADAKAEAEDAADCRDAVQKFLNAAAESTPEQAMGLVLALVNTCKLTIPIPQS